MVTDVGDQMCWWQPWMLMTDFIHSEITNITKIVANIMILPPTSEISHHYKVTNITMSPTSLSPIFLFYFVKKKENSNFGLIYDARNFIKGCLVFHRTFRNKFLATSGGYFRNSKVLFWTQIQFWILWLKICRLLNLFLAFLPD